MWPGKARKSRWSPCPLPRMEIARCPASWAASTNINPPWRCVMRAIWPSRRQGPGQIRGPRHGDQHARPCPAAGQDDLPRHSDPTRRRRRQECGRDSSPAKAGRWNCARIPRGIPCRHPPRRSSFRRSLLMAAVVLPVTQSNVSNTTDEAAGLSLKGRGSVLCPSPPSVLVEPGLQLERQRHQHPRSLRLARRRVGEACRVMENVVVVSIPTEPVKKHHLTILQRHSGILTTQWCCKLGLVAKEVSNENGTMNPHQVAAPETEGEDPSRQLRLHR